MKRFIMVCFTMFLTFVLLVGACAEGIQSEQVDLPVEEEVNVPLFSGELGESELPTVEKDAFGTDVADFSDMVFVVEAAPLDADDTEAGEQAVMAASNECKHEKVYSSWSSDQPRFTASGKYQHNVDYNVSSTTLYCYDCKDWLGISNIAVGSYNPSKPAHIQHSEACVFDPETGKCYFCGQTGKACAHKNYVNCGRQKDVYSFYNNLNHVHKVVTPSLKAVCLCKTCGMVGQVQNNGTVNWNWCSLEGYMTDYMNGFIENENDQIEIKSSKLEAHTYVNGVCSKCGYVKSGSTTTATTVKLSAKSVTLGKKETFKLTATVKPAGKAKSLRFKSTNTKVAVVNAKTGKITAKKAGTATIKAKIGSKTLATCKVTVKKTPKKVTLNKSKVTLKKGKIFQLKATLPTGTYTRKLTWTSSNKKVAKVSSKGKVTAVGKGTATITIKTAGGVKTTCKVTVKKAKNNDIDSENHRWSTAYKHYIIGEGYLKSSLYFDKTDTPDWEVAFALYDINMDGIPELFANNGSIDYYNFRRYVFTYRDNKIAYLGELGPGSGTPEYWENEKYTGVLYFDTAGYYNRYLSISNNALQSCNVDKLEYEYDTGNYELVKLTKDDTLFNLVNSNVPRKEISFYSPNRIKQMGWDSFVHKANLGGQK